jgi:GntR family transcriptional regulator
MRLWLKKNSEVPLREQLVTQFVLGIVSNDLKAGQRLPSTRELARRYKIHANTVSAAYRELARRRWVDFRKGSGIYVRSERITAADDGLELDELISRLFRSARDIGYSAADLHSALRRWLAIQPPDHFLLIESDLEQRFSRWRSRRQLEHESSP